MLLTTCPNCAAQFKVQPEQLNVRQGRVMCGRCRQVFDAFQSLTRLEEGAPSRENDTQTEADGQSLTESATEPRVLMELPPSPESGAPPFESGMRDEPTGPTGAEAHEGQDVAPEASPLQHQSREKIALQLETPGNFSVEPASPVPPGLVLEADNPLLAPPPPSYSTMPKSGYGWVTVSIVLGLALAGQIAYFYRAQVAQQFPQTRPILSAACDWLGCLVPRGRDESAIRIEASDLVEPPGRTGRIMLTATIANRSAHTQEYPALELRLTDSGNQIVLSRIFQPPEYLGRSPAKEESISPGAEVFVNMQLELLAKPSASGYGVRAFYP